MKPDIFGMPLWNLHRVRWHHHINNDITFPGYFDEGTFTLGRSPAQIWRKRWEMQDVLYVDDGENFYTVKEPVFDQVTHFIRYKAELVPENLRPRPDDESTLIYFFPDSKISRIRCWITDDGNGTFTILTSSDLAWIPKNFREGSTGYIDGKAYLIQSIFKEPIFGNVAMKATLVC